MKKLFIILLICLMPGLTWGWMMTQIVGGASADITGGVYWPLRINATGKYIEQQNGTPFPIIADAAWNLPTQVSQADVMTYLNDRQSRGYTAILIQVTDRYYQDNAPQNYYGEVPFTNGVSDWSIRTENYWANVDYVVNQIKQRGMAAILFPAYFGSSDAKGWRQQMVSQTNSAMTSYGTFLAQRYGGYGNIIWVHGGDARCSDITNLCDRANAIATAIYTALPNSIQTAHSAGLYSAMDDYSGQSWLNLNSVYTIETTCVNVASEMEAEYERSGALPIVYLEGIYENHTGSTLLCLQSQGMISYLGGGLAGSVFGNCPIWNFGSWAGTTYCASTDWEGNLDSNGSVSFSNIGKLIKSRKWYSLIPDYSNTVVTAGKGSGATYHATARETTGETVMAWCPDATQITVDMTEVSGASAKAWWYNPNTNNSALIGSYATSGSENFAPAFAGRVLVLDDLSKGYAEPGGGSTVSECTDGLLFSWHMENADVTSGTPAGCSIGDTIATLGSNVSFSATKQDGTYSRNYPDDVNDDTYYDLFSVSGEDIVKNAEGTIDVWVYVTTYVTGAVLINARADSNNQIRIQLINDGSAYRQFRIERKGGGTARYTQTTIANPGLATDTWYHVIGKWRTSGSPYLSICADTSTGTGNCGTSATAPATWNGTMSELYFGSWIVLHPNFNIDNVKIWDSWK